MLKTVLSTIGVLSFCFVASSFAQVEMKAVESINSQEYTYQSDIATFKEEPMYVAYAWPKRKPLNGSTQGRMNINLRLNETTGLNRADILQTALVKKIATSPSSMVTANTDDFPAVANTDTVGHQPTKVGSSVNSPTQCSIPNVYFGLGSADVDNKTIVPIANNIKGCKVDGVDVYGYTCELGSQDFNDRLANARANNVASKLRDSGVTVNNVVGKGKSNYVTRDPRKLEQNRRAVITITEEKQ
jgi:outer membrane protein OmpA-like peptidoglycan-associated protein